MDKEVKIIWKKFCGSLKKHTIKIINFQTKKRKLLIKGYQESYENAKICYICNKLFENKYLKDKECCKVRDHCHYKSEYGGAEHSICNLKYSVPEKTL